MGSSVADDIVSLEDVTIVEKVIALRKERDVDCALLLAELRIDPVDWSRALKAHVEGPNGYNFVQVYKEAFGRMPFGYAKAMRRGRMATFPGHMPANKPAVALGPQTSSEEAQDALNQIVDALRPLSGHARDKVLAAVAVFFGLEIL